MANPTTSKFTENIGYNTFKKLPKFDGDGSSLLHATPIVPIHLTHPVYDYKQSFLALQRDENEPKNKIFYRAIF